jgi:hypothetical protein
MLRVFASEYDFVFKNVTNSACPITFYGKRDWIKKKYRESCLAYLNEIKGEISKYDTIVIGGSWSTYYRVGGKEFKRGFRKTISKLSRSATKIIILDKAPVFKNYNQQFDVRGLRIPELNCVERFDIRDNDFKANKFIFNVTRKYKNVHFFSARNQLCANGYCSPYNHGNSLYFNKSHISMLGSEKIGRLMIEDGDSNLAAFKP